MAIRNRGLITGEKTIKPLARLVEKQHPQSITAAVLFPPKKQAIKTIQRGTIVVMVQRIDTEDEFYASR